MSLAGPSSLVSLPGPQPGESYVETSISLSASAAGRVSGKSWKQLKSATVRSYIPEGLKTKKWEDRMEKTKKEQAIKKLQAELRDEKQAEITRRKEITLERKKAAEERQRLEEAKAKLTNIANVDGREKSGQVTPQSRSNQKDSSLTSQLSDSLKLVHRALLPTGPQSKTDGTFV
ncbi:hypothetical protein A0H81_00873 [Grifola frondosa]|uniref:rRNA-processing protein n=1 Tax=Grifola frondosa TaxID=5627 RepID=A0A1C7MPC6_GRIFR|nr:hypothetical protein A0H81_00873 [Grifola frondosa]